MSLEVDVSHARGGFSLHARFHAGGRLTVLFGRSGAGKSTLIDIIAGLARPDRGRVVVDGRPLTDTEAGLFLPPHRRRLGYVFQDARLFPHLTVRQNLLYGRWFAPGDGGAAPSLDAVLDMLGIGHLLARRPASLSGGERQRVAIGRALLARPRLLLMDEPLASLDEARKAEILPYVERLRDEGQTPIVYVSHSVAEVARLATDLIVLDEGRVAAAGPAADIMARLGVAGLSREPESGAVLKARVEEHDDRYGLTVLAARAGRLETPRLRLPVGATVAARIRARDVIVSLSEPREMSALNALAGVVAEIGEASDGIVEVKLDCHGDALLARLTRKSVERLNLALGRPVFAIVKSIAFDAEAVAGGRHAALIERDAH